MDYEMALPIVTLSSARSSAMRLSDFDALSFDCYGTLIGAVK